MLRRDEQSSLEKRIQADTREMKTSEKGGNGGRDEASKVQKLPEKGSKAGPAAKPHA